MIKFLITNNQVITFEDFHYSFNFDRIVYSGSISDEKVVLQCKGMPFILYLYQTETDWQYYTTPIESPEAYHIIHEWFE